MTRATTWVVSAWIVCVAISACSTSATSARSTSTPRGTAAPRVVPAAAGGAIDDAPDDGARPTACRFGLVTKAVQSVPHPPAASQDTGPPPDLAALFPGGHEISDVATLSREDGLEIVAATVWITREDGEIRFAARRRGVAAGSAITVDASPLLDGEPKLAWTGEGDRFAIAWGRGRYPFRSDLHLAIAEPARVVSASRIVLGAQPEGHAIVRTGRTLLAAYTPTSAGGSSGRGVYVVATDLDGRVTRRTRVLAGDGLWPIAAALPDGSAAGLVYRLDRAALGFALIGADGAVREGPTVVDRHDDPAASYRASQVRYGDGLFWVGASVGFHVSVIVAAPSEARLLGVDARGRATGSLRVSGSRHAAPMALRAEGDGVSLTYADRAGLHHARVVCRDRAPTEEELRPGPCDPRIERWRRGRFTPMRDAFRAVAVENGWVVAYRAREPRDGYVGWGEPRAARVRTDGVTLWDVELGEGELDAQLVARDGRVAIPWSASDRAKLTILDVATGAERGAYRLERGAAATGAACVAASGRGWMVAFAQSDGPSQVLWLGDDGRMDGRAEVRDRWNGCGLVEVRDGFAMAFTTRGRSSESNWIYTIGLDVRGAPRGEPTRIEGEGFARDPMLVREGDGALAVWTGPVVRELVGQHIDASGRATGEMTELARTYGMSGYGIGARDGAIELFWASQRGGIGVRRICPPTPP